MMRPITATNMDYTLGNVVTHVNKVELYTRVLLPIISLTLQDAKLGKVTDARVGGPSVVTICFSGGLPTVIVRRRSTGVVAIDSNTGSFALRPRRELVAAIR